MGGFGVVSSFAGTVVSLFGGRLLGLLSGVSLCAGTCSVMLLPLRAGAHCAKFGVSRAVEKIRHIHFTSSGGPLGCSLAGSFGVNALGVLAPGSFARPGSVKRLVCTCVITAAAVL